MPRRRVRCGDVAPLPPELRIRAVEELGIRKRGSPVWQRGTPPQIPGPPATRPVDRSTSLQYGYSLPVASRSAAAARKARRATCGSHDRERPDPTQAIPNETPATAATSHATVGTGKPNHNSTTE